MEQQFQKPIDFQKYLQRTAILDFDHPVIQALVTEKGWRQLTDPKNVKRIYDYVKDEVKFGYNAKDTLSASEVLNDGFGQCNTKANLLMALLRAVGIPNRIHGFTIHKALQKGAITGVWYTFSPNNILHSWVEVYVLGKWFNLEGLILDKDYLSALQNKFLDCKTSFCGYGAYTDNFQEPQVEWNFNNTYIQDKGINQDFGVFDSPDGFYKKHQQQLNPLKKWIYKNYVRHLMNRNVEKIRKSGIYPKIE